MQTSDMSRRHFMQLAGGAALGFVVLQLTGCESNSVDPITAGGEVPFLTPVNSFYYKNGAEGSISQWSMPNLDPSTWRLAIDGLVSAPKSLTYQDILDAEATAGVKLLKTMRCVIDSNEVQGLIGTAIWTGVPLRTFLDLAGVDRTRTMRLRFHGADGFTNNIRIGRFYEQQPADLVEPLLVTHMNGQALPAKHGYPVRLILHEGFGYKNVKWLTRVEATDSDDPFGTYQNEGFVDDGVMRVVSRMTDPLANITVAAGAVRCVGFAVSGAAGITTVEISVDDGTFLPADLRTQDEAFATDATLATTIQATAPETFHFPYRAVWAQWRFTFNATPGPHTVRIRATDADGNVQPAADPGIEDGVNAIPTVQFTAV